MDITITDLTEEQADTVNVFAHAVKTESTKEVEYFDKFAKNFLSKKSREFDFTRSYRIKPQPSYLDLHKASGLKVGDRVKINNGEVKEENGYKFSRSDQGIRGYKSYEGQITYDQLEKGFWVDGEYLLPYYVLEKIEEEWIVKFFFNKRWVLDELIYPSKEAAKAGLISGSTYEIIQIK